MTFFPVRTDSQKDKQQEIDDQDTWTRVGPNGRKSRKPPPKAKHGHHKDRPSTANNLSVDDLKANHEKYASRWRQSDSYKKLCELLEKNASSHVGITNAVCLGIGSFDPESCSVKSQRLAHIQLEAFLTMAKFFGAENPSTIDCIYQEPVWTRPECDFIASLGGTVVEDPASRESVGPNTLVYGIHLYAEVWGDALERSLPGLVVGTPGCLYEDLYGNASLTPELRAAVARIKEVDDVDFDKFPFPEPDDYTFSSTHIRWRALSQPSREEVRSGDLAALLGRLSDMGLEPKAEVASTTGTEAVIQAEPNRELQFEAARRLALEGTPKTDSRPILEVSEVEDRPNIHFN